MDIKDFILIGGGILIALVVAHGFWIALRAKRETLRMDIVPDLIPDDVDDIERFRGELPNGPARVRSAVAEPAEQESFDLEPPAPTLMDPVEEPVGASSARATPVVHQAPPRKSATTSEMAPEPAPASEPVEPVIAPVNAQELATPSRAANDEPEEGDNSRPAVREVQIESDNRGRMAGPKNPALQRSLARRRERATPTPPVRKPESQVSPAEIGVEELFVLNVLAPKGTMFDGEDLVNVLRAEGLRYGAMNIFHRVDVTTKAKVFSVANAVKPGTFDLADIEHLRSPGMAMFMQLPGPDDPSAAFEDMLGVARAVQRALGGEIRDENMSVLSGQTVEHMRQRIADYVRRRLSLRAQTSA